MALTTLVGKATPRTQRRPTVNTGTKSTIANSPNPVRVRTSAGNLTGGLRGNKINPYPSIPRGTKVGMTPGGPEPGVPKGNKGRAGKPTGQKPLIPLIRGPRMATRVYTPKQGIRGAAQSHRIRIARENLRTKPGRRVINPKGPGRIVKTQGKTKIIGPNRTVIVTKRGSVIRGKRAGGWVSRERYIGQKGKPGYRRVVRNRYGVGTKTKADDWAARKISRPGRTRLVVNKNGKTYIVARRRATPNRLKVVVKGPKGHVQMRRVVGPKYTRTTRRGKTLTQRTKYISAEQNRRTGEVGEKNWIRAGAGMKGKTNRYQEPKRNINPPPPKPKSGKKPLAKKARKVTQQVPHWKRVQRFRAQRRRRGARYNLSYTKTQLKNQAARQYS